MSARAHIFSTGIRPMTRLDDCASSTSSKPSSLSCVSTAGDFSESQMRSSALPSRTDFASASPRLFFPSPNRPPPRPLFPSPQPLEGRGDLRVQPLQELLPLLLRGVGRRGRDRLKLP